MDMKKDLTLEITNPEKINIVLSMAAMVFGVSLAFVPGVFYNFGAYIFYFHFFGGVTVFFGMASLLIYRRRAKQFENFVSSEENKIVWSYSPELYLNYLYELSRLQFNANLKRFLTLVAIVAVVSIGMYVFLPVEQKLLSIVFFLFFTVFNFLFVVVFPLGFRFKGMATPYVSIIGTKEAYVMGRYHRWNRCYAKVKNYDSEKNHIKVLALNYESMTSNGKLFKEWYAIIPDNSSENQKLVKKQANLINKSTKVFEEDKGQDMDFLERLFTKMIEKFRK